jgi:hypothetical protein
MIGTRRRRGDLAACGERAGRGLTPLAMALCLGAVLVSRPAHAQQTVRDPIAAEALFERGKQLMDQGRTHDACSAFAESERLDPAGGTLLRLALCHETEGKLASAWLEYLEVERISKEGTGDPGKLAERVRLAREHLATVGPRVPKLAIRVQPPARVDGLRVSANGLPRNEGSWGVGLPVDPGDVVVTASAPGHRTSQTNVHLAEGQETTIEIVPLAAEPAPAPTETSTATPSPAPSAHSSVARPVGVAVGAAGIVAVGVGAVFGALAISKWNQSNDACPGTSCASSNGVTLASDARSAARVADVTLAAGAAVVVAGVILYVAGAPRSGSLRGTASGVALSF